MPGRHSPRRAATGHFFSQERGGANIGFGAERFVYKGLGVGAESGYAGPDWSFSGSGAVGVGSIDASYHFFRRKHHGKLDPFAVGGYSLYFGERLSFQNGYNLGGGVNIWFAKHAALRFEVRDQSHIDHFHSSFANFAAFRAGMTFR